MTITATTPAVKTAPAVKTELTATKDVKAKIDRLRELRAIENEAKKEAKALTAEILNFAGPFTKAIKWGKTVLATIVDSTSARSTDFEALAAGWPEAYTACVKPGTPYKQVR